MKQKHFKTPSSGIFRQIGTTRCKKNESLAIFATLGSVLEGLYWDKVKKCIQATPILSYVQTVVHFFPNWLKRTTKDISVKTEWDRELVRAQQVDKSLQNVCRWVKRRISPKRNDLRELPRLGWHMSFTWAVCTSRIAFFGKNLRLSKVVKLTIKRPFPRCWSLILTIPTTSLWLLAICVTSKYWKKSHHDYIGVKKHLSQYGKYQISEAFWPSTEKLSFACFL